MDSEKHTSAAVGANVRRLRTAAGYTTRGLAGQLQEFGVPMSGSGITDIEQGRRTVSVDQLTALAVALDTSPAYLLSPQPEDPSEEVILSGVVPGTAVNVHLWVRGDRDLTDEMLDDYERETYRRAANPPWTWKKKD